LLLGILLVLTPGVVDVAHAGWFHVKMLAVLLLFGFHGAASRWRRDFLQDRNRKPARFYRIANEVPTVLMLVAVIMAVVKPF
jgi:protoporphyrinogen IX oxidase